MNEWFNPDEMVVRALQSRNEIDEFTHRVKNLGLKSHHDHQKNWDTLLTFMALSELKIPTIRMLDAGSGAKSVILQWVRNKFPKSELFACDRINQNRKLFIELKIDFSIQDMSKTSYESNYFDFIASISVIEHGVNVFEFIKECNRVLKIGGILTISTDYWPVKKEFLDKFPYGKEYGPMKLFSKEEIIEICDFAEKNGFEIVNKFDQEKLNCQETAVRWERMSEDYTFCFIPLRKIH